MAQKALKTLAAKNAATLNRTHLLSLAINALFLLIRTFLSTRSLYAYILLNLPALVIEFWFERIARPSYSSSSSSSSSNSGNELKRAGEDLEAQGLTEWMWDVMYWTWGCIGVVAVVGDKGWWLWAGIPLYSGYLAFTTYTGMRSGFGNMMGGGGGGGAGSEKGGNAAEQQSKRQSKMEKRGGQRVQYR